MTTIIYLSDDPRSNENVTDILRQEGYTVLLAGNEREGLDMILEHMPNLVLYNLTASHEGRHQILDEVRGRYPLLAEMPFIYFSDVADNEQILTDLKAGADTYITKPVDSTLLLAKIHASLRQVKRIKFKHERLLVLDI